jgi:PAS domain S-box-containing protein
VPSSSNPALLPRILAVAGAYLLTAIISLLSPADAPDARLFWFPTGVSIALLVRWGLGVWPGIFLGGIIVNVHLGYSPSFILLEPLGKTLGPVVVAWWLKRVGFQRTFPRREDVISFCGASILGMIIPPTWGVFWLLLGGQLQALDEALSTWSIWWLGDTVGVLLIAPFLLSIGAGCFDSLRERPGEFALWVFLVMGAVTAILVSPSSTGAWITFALLPVPLMVWAATRFGLSVASLWVLTLTGVGMVEAILGQGVFRLESKTDSLLILWAYLASFVIIGLFITALQNEQRDTTRRLRQTTSLQSLLIKLATGFLNTPEESLDVAIDKAMAELGILTGTDRVYVFRYDHDNRTLTNTHEWCQEGVTSEKQNLQDMPYDVIPNWAERHQRGEIIHVPNVQELPHDSPLRAVLEPQKVRTLITVPMIAEGVCLGFVGFDDVRNLRSWSEDEKNILRVLAEMITNVEVRRRQSIALQRSRAEYESVVRYQRELVCRYLPDTTLTFVNDAYCRWASRAREELLGRRFIEFLGEQDRPGMFSHINRLIETGESNTYEHSSIKPDGSVRWHLWTDVLLPADPGGRIELQSVGIDITERKQAEESLRLYQEQLRLIVDLVPGYLYAKDDEGRILFANRSIAEMMGCQPEDLIGKQTSLIGIPPELLEEYLQQDREVFRTQQLLTIPQDRARRLDGTMGWFKTYKIPFQQPGHSRPAVLGLSIDITEQMIAEDANVRYREMLQEIIDLLPAYIFAKNAEGRFIFINKSLADVFQTTPQEVIGKRDEDFGATVEQAEQLRAEERKVMEEDQPLFVPELPVRISSQQMAWFQSTKVPFQVPLDKSPAVLGVAVDITDRLLAEKSIRESEARLRTIGDNLPDGAIYRIHQLRDGTIEIPYISAGIERILGYTAAEVMQNPLVMQETLHPDDVADYELASIETLRTLEPYDHIWRYQHKDGSLRWLHMRSTSWRTAEGGLIADGVATDVTTRILAEEAVRQGERLMRALGDNMPTIALIRVERSPEGVVRITHVSRGIEHILERSAEDFIDGRAYISSCLPPDVRERYLAEARVCVEEMRDFVFEAYRKRNNGEDQWIELRSQHRRTPEDFVISEGVIIDITARKKAEQALVSSQQLLRTISDNVPNVALIQWERRRGESARIIHVSRGVEEILERPASDFLERGVLVFDCLPPGERERYAAMSAQCVETMTDFQGEFRRLRANGEEQWIEIRAQYRIGENDLIMTDGVLIDITARRRIEEALRQEQNLFVGGPALVIVWSTEEGWPVLYVSRNLPSILGYSTEQFLHPDFRYASLMHPEDLLSNAEEARLHVAERRESWEQTYRLLHADGGYRWFYDFTVPEYDADGKLLRIRGYLVDKTTEVRAEEQILAQKQQLDNFFTVTLDLLAISDTQGRFVRLNPEWENLLGYPLSELEGRFFMELVHEDDVPKTTEALGALRRGENVYSFHNRYRRADDTYRILEWRAHILEDSIYAAARDITDRIQYEEALRASEATLRSYIEHAPMGVLVINADARYIDANPIGLRMLRCTREELLARNVWDFVAPSSLEPGLELFQRMISGEVMESEILLRCIDGHEFWARSYAVSLGPDRYMSFIVDITNEHEMERVRQRMEEELRQAQKMEAIGLLAGGVAHDFNNMLQVIQSHADIVLEDLEEMSPVRGDINQIRRAAARSTELVRQLLAFSRKQAVEPRVVDLNAIIQDRTSMLRRLIDPLIEMKFEPAPDVWPVRIDTSQIDQILTNLVVNARDAIAAGGVITIQTCNREVDEAMASSHMGLSPGSYAVILVEDTGHGMDAATLSRVFEPFFTTKKHGLGTGLGLATVYGIVKQNKGCITISSQPGAGTQVEIFLPRHRGLITPESTPEPHQPKPVARETILVVEDEPSILSGVSRILEAHGYTVLGAGTGTRAQELAAAHQGPIHLLLSDVVMPQMNGRELQEKILLLRPDVRTLFMSGYSADVISKDGEVAPNIAFVQKPFTIEQLTRKIREVLDA